MCELSTVTPLWLFGKSHDVRCVSVLSYKLTRERANTVLTHYLSLSFSFSYSRWFPVQTVHHVRVRVRRKDTALREHKKKKREKSSTIATTTNIMHWRFHFFFFFLLLSFTLFPSPSLSLFLCLSFFLAWQLFVFTRVVNENIQQLKEIKKKLVTTARHWESTIWDLACNCNTHTTVYNSIANLHSCARSFDRSFTHSITHSFATSYTNRASLIAKFSNIAISFSRFRLCFLDLSSGCVFFLLLRSSLSLFFYSVSV